MCVVLRRTKTVVFCWNSDQYVLVTIIRSSYYVTHLYNSLFFLTRRYLTLPIALLFPNQSRDGNSIINVTPSACNHTVHIHALVKTWGANSVFVCESCFLAKLCILLLMRIFKGFLSASTKHKTISRDKYFQGQLRTSSPQRSTM